MAIVVLNSPFTRIMKGCPLLVHIVFYAGFRAETVTDRLPVIDRHFPNYNFQAYIDSLPPARSAAEVIAVRDSFERLFRFLGERTAFHFMTDIGFPVLKPDRVIKRIFRRLGLIDNDLKGAALYVALIEEGRNFAHATTHPIRYIDIVLVGYGQVQTKDIGIERGICLEMNPSCSVCGVTKYCDYYEASSICLCSDLQTMRGLPSR